MSVQNDTNRGTAIFVDGFSDLMCPNSSCYDATIGSVLEDAQINLSTLTLSYIDTKDIAILLWCEANFDHVKKNKSFGYGRLAE